MLVKKFNIIILYTCDRSVSLDCHVIKKVMYLIILNTMKCLHERDVQDLCQTKKMVARYVLPQGSRQILIE